MRHPELFGDFEARLDQIVLVVAEELGELAGPGALEGLDADDLDRPAVGLSADDLERHDADGLHGRGHGLDLVAGDVFNPGADLFVVGEAVHVE